MKRRFIQLGGLIAVFILVACTKPPEKDVAILIHHDRWGEIAPCGCPGHPTGGLAHYVPVFRKHKEQGALAVEAGDTFYPPPRFRKETPEKQKEWAAFIRETMAGLSYDAFVPGEMELEDGLDAFIEYARGAHLPVTVANMVDAETGDPIFETSRIVTNGNGVRVAFVGIAGPAAFAGVTANADFSADVWREDHRARVSDKPKALVKKVGKLLEKTQSEDADEKTKEQLAGLLAAFGDPEAEEAPAALDPPAYEGRRFRLTDPLEAATAERQKLEGRADLYVLVTHLKKNESRTFQSKIKGYQFQIDSHADLKPRALQSAEKGAPFAIRTGNKGKTMGLLTVHLAGGGWEFEDRTLAQRKTKALERYGKQYERLRAEAGGDPLEKYGPDDRRYKRAKRVQERIAQLQGEVGYREGASYFMLDRLVLDQKMPNDAGLLKRMDELSPPSER